MRSLDLFSCVGNHALGFKRAGIDTVALCEIVDWRQKVLAKNFRSILIYGDVTKLPPVRADIVIGGPPCQETSVASAIHGKRTGESLWPWMLRAGINAGAEWFVVEQPPGHAAWETKVANDLSDAGYHVARFEFGAHDVGAPYIRRRVFMVACTRLSRLALARQSLPCAIDSTKRAADARGDWNPDTIPTFGMDTWRSERVDERRQRIEALGDSNPPHMAEVIGRAIVEASRVQQPTESLL